MSLLITGLVLFLGIHSVSILAPGARDRIVARLGEGPWKGLYALVALVGLVLVIRGFMPARAVAGTVYLATAPMRAAALVLMAAALVSLCATHLPGRIQRTLGHPMLFATQLWAVAHLLANGSSADLVLFGSLLAWATLDRYSLTRRPPRALRMAPARAWNDALAVVLGLGLWALLVGGLHRVLFGVAPLG